MRTPLSLLALMALATSLRGNDSHTNFVLQIPQGGGSTWLMPDVPPNGEGSSLAPLGEGGALFQLWTLENHSGREYLLDQKTVAAYLPRAQIEVKTDDPFEKFPRTRADQPFQVRITVSDLLPGASDLPLAASSVLAEHHLAPYVDGPGSVDAASAVSGTPAGHAYITSNGLTEVNFNTSVLPAPQPGKAFGEEHFVVHVLADGAIEQTQIAAGFVQVWPEAEGYISGIKQGDTVGMYMPPLTISLTDLYPGSYTYVRVRHLDSGHEAILSRSEYVLPDEPQETGKLIQITDYASAFPVDGTYSMELLTRTPFDTKPLHKIIFDVDRELTIRGHLVDIDRGN